MIKVAPSILAADLLNLASEIESVRSAGADWLHLDIMDGHFVPNLSFGPALVQAIAARFPDTFRDVHLMLENPQDYLEKFMDAGANAVTIHAEVRGVPDMLRRIRQRGVLAGVSINPKTNPEVIKPWLDQMDLVLVMTVEPGFGGQKFMENCAQKVKTIRDFGFQGHISVDGGVNIENAHMLKDLGADVLVMGTTVFRSKDRSSVINVIHEME